MPPVLEVENELLRGKTDFLRRAKSGWVGVGAGMRSSLRTKEIQR